MRKIPWKGLAIGCGILTVLVIIRSIITARRFLYYGGLYWQQEVFEDPWLYIGMVSAAACVAALLALAGQERKNEKQEKDANGRGE